MSFSNISFLGCISLCKFMRNVKYGQVNSLGLVIYILKCAYNIIPIIAIKLVVIFLADMHDPVHLAGDRTFGNTTQFVD